MLVIWTLDDMPKESMADLVEDIAEKKNGISDLDWSEICSKYKLKINAETLRKAGVGVKLVADAGRLRTRVDMELPFDWNSVSDGYVERQKIRDLNSKVKNALRQESRSQLLRETIAESIKKLPKLEFVSRGVSHTEDYENVLVLAMGDFHYGADIMVKGLHGEVINKYNHVIFEQRMEELLEELGIILIKEDIDNIQIFLVGDLLDGMLRQSQLMRLEYGLVESAMKVSETLAVWLTKLSEHSDVTVNAVSGNHSEVRPLNSKHRDFEDENLEKIIMWYLQERLKDNEYVHINASCERMNLVNVLGYNFLLLHGDGEKGIKDIAKDTINLYREPIDFFVCGHKHREEEFPTGITANGEGQVIRVPSFCGVDRYAQSKGFGGKPGATAIVMERGYGRRCVYPIQLRS